MLLKAALAWMFQRNYCNSLSVFIGLSNTCKLVIIFLGELHYKQFWFMLLNDYVKLSFASTYKNNISDMILVAITSFIHLLALVWWPWTLTLAALQSGHTGTMCYCVLDWHTRPGWADTLVKLQSCRGTFLQKAV